MSGGVVTIVKRELVGYFVSPVAYVFLVIFLLLTGFFTYTVGNFFERGEASLVSFFNPGMVVIGGQVASVGHELLAEIRSVVYRRSLPLATGNLPVVLSELGSRAGVTGAAVLASDTAFEQAAS